MTNETQKPARAVALMAARAAALGGRSPRARGEQKAREALDWVYRWGWASASTLDALASKRRGLAARLVRMGLLRSTRTESGGGVRGVPAAILTLTSLGLAEVERYREDLLPYSVDPYRIRQDQLRHYQLAQALTAEALSDKKIKAFQTELEMAECSGAHFQQPDIVWMLPTGHRMAVEVELSAKWGPDLDHFVLSCLLSLSPKEKGGMPRFDYIVVMTDSPAINRRYQAAFEPGAMYALWQKDARSRWRQTDSRTVPEWVKGKMQWRLLVD